MSNQEEFQRRPNEPGALPYVGCLPKEFADKIAIKNKKLFVLGDILRVASSIPGAPIEELEDLILSSQNIATIVRFAVIVRGASIERAAAALIENLRPTQASSGFKKLRESFPEILTDEFVSELQSGVRL